MSVYSDTYTVTVRYGKDNSWWWSDCTAEFAERITKIVEEQGPPERVKEEAGWALIIPEMVQYVTVRRPRLSCPDCGTWTHVGKNCTHPEYHGD